MLPVQGGDFAGGAREQLFKAARTDAEQRLVRETQFRFRDELELHVLFQRGVVRRADIADGDFFCLNRVGEFFCSHRISIQEAFDGVARFGIAGAAGMTSRSFAAITSAEHLAN